MLRQNLIFILSLFFLNSFSRLILVDPDNLNINKPEEKCLPNGVRYTYTSHDANSKGSNSNLMQNGNFGWREVDLKMLQIKNELQRMNIGNNALDFMGKRSIPRCSENREISLINKIEEADNLSYPGMSAVIELNSEEDFEAIIQDKREDRSVLVCIGNKYLPKSVEIYSKFEELSLKLKYGGIFVFVDIDKFQDIAKKYNTVSDFTFLAFQKSVLVSRLDNCMPGQLENFINSQIKS